MTPYIKCAAASAAFALVTVGQAHADSISDAPSLHPIPNIAASYAIQGPSSKINVMEFPEQTEQCIMVVARVNGQHKELESCFPQEKAAPLSAPRIDSIDDKGGQHIVTFTPKTAPDWSCSAGYTDDGKPIVNGCSPKPGFDPFQP